MTVLAESVLPDGTVLPDLYGSQVPTWHTSPPRHRFDAPEEGCKSCKRLGFGCGDYVSRDMLQWLREVAKYDLDPWQEWAITETCGCKPNGKWAALETCIICCRQNGKGAILEARELAGLYLLSEGLIIHTAQQFSTSIEHLQRMVTAVTENPALSKRLLGPPKMSHGSESIQLKPQPTLIFGSTGRQVRRTVAPRLRFMARSKSAARGFSCDCLVWDEAMLLSAEQTGASFPTMSARPNPQIWLTGSSGLKDSFELASRRRRIHRDSQDLAGLEWAINHHRDTCTVDRVNGRRSNNYIVCDEHDDRDDPRSWAKANPAYNIRISPEYIASEMAAMEGAPEEFDRERLGVGQWPDEEEAWGVISEDRWTRLTLEDPGEIRKPLCFAVDVAEGGKNAVIAACWVRPNPDYAIEVGKSIDEQREPQLDSIPREHFILEIPQGCAREGVEWVIPELNELRKKYHPAVIILPRQGPGAALIGDAERIWGEKDKGWATAGSADEAAAYALLVQYANKEHELIRHMGKERAATLWYAVAKADKRKVGDGGYALSRNESKGDISAFTAATLALWACNAKRRSYDIMNTIA